MVAEMIQLHRKNIIWGRSAECCLLAVFASFIVVTIVGAENSVFAEGLKFQPVAGQRQLFLDDVGIAQLENLKRTMHSPTKKGAVIRPNWHLGVLSLQTRTSPVWDDKKKVFKFWDCAASPPDLYAIGKQCTGYYESPDGLNWSKPVLGQIEYDRWPQNNYISLTSQGRHVRVDYVVRDLTDPDPSRRYKAALPPIGFAVSPDGIHWEMLPDVKGVPSEDEANFSFDVQSQLFILTVKRGGPHGRAVHLETSTDFLNWTNHGLIFHADDRDQELGRHRILARLADPTMQQLVGNDPSRYNVDVYNMGVFRYESLYIGTPAMYHATGPSADGSNTDGFHEVQLVCSRNLKSWKRLGDREPFIATSRTGAGAYDLTGMIGPSNAVMRGDELWFYYTSGKYRRQPDLVEPDNHGISLAVLRRDGFISLDAGDTSGTLVTEAFTVSGSELLVNVNAVQGELLVEVLNQEGKLVARSKPMSGDLLHEQVEWVEGNIIDLKSQDVSLSFTVRNAQFYSYWLD